MLEAELAGVMKFILGAVQVTPYYHEIPRDFVVPAVYFPHPEITSSGDTLSGYRLSYTWFIKFIATTTPLAYEAARQAVAAIMDARRLIPLYTADGKATGYGFRVEDPSISKVERGRYQMALAWDSPRCYTEQEAQKMMHYELNLYSKE